MKHGVGGYYAGAKYLRATQSRRCSAMYDGERAALLAFIVLTAWLFSTIPTPTAIIRDIQVSRKAQVLAVNPAEPDSCE